MKLINKLVLRVISLETEMKSRIQAVISQNRRDEVRKTTALYILGILMIALIWEMGKEIVKPNIIFIENTHAEMVTAAAEVSRYESTAIEVEHAVEIKTESTQQLIEKMIMDEFGSDGKIMIAIAKAESGLNPKQESTTDRMIDGRAYSFGLMQINLTQHRIDGLECHSAFKGKNNNAVVINENLYQQCIEKANNQVIAIKKAKEIYTGRGNTFLAWGAFTNNAYLRNI